MTLLIGGRTYSVACGDGEEAHINDLGRIIDDRLKRLSGGSQQGEARALLYVALMLADEIHEYSKKLSEPRGSAQLLDEIAVRLENLALHLENAASQA